MRLLKTHTRTVTRKTAGTGYFDDNGNWVDSPTAITVFTVKGSRQPFRNGDQQIELPEGVTSDEAFFWYSKDKLLTNNEFTNQVADEMEDDGYTYECFIVEDWTGYSLRTDHYKHVFIRKDKGDGT